MEYLHAINRRRYADYLAYVLQAIKVGDVQAAYVYARLSARLAMAKYDSLEYR